MSNRIQVGEDAFVIGVGEGRDSVTDLFAAPAGGGTFVRFTFTRAEERLPRLSPTGTAVAFIRHDRDADASRGSLVVLDLHTNLERSAPLPGDAGTPVRIGWSPDGGAVVLDAGSYFMMPATTGDRLLTALPAGRSAAADSMTGELLGDPRSAVVRECTGGGVCIVAATGDTSPLEAGATDAIRWGSDSVGYFTPRGFEVRPLAGGRSRRPAWSAPPSGLRQLTYHPGRRW